MRNEDSDPNLCPRPCYAIAGLVLSWLQLKHSVIQPPTPHPRPALLGWKQEIRTADVTFPELGQENQLNLNQILFSFSPSVVTGAMSDPAPVVDPSPAPPAPSGPRPKVTNRGRTAVAVASSNSESMDVPEFEPFVAPGPRGFPPLTGEQRPRTQTCWSDLEPSPRAFICFVRQAHCYKSTFTI